MGGVIKSVGGGLGNLVGGVAGNALGGLSNSFFNSSGKQEAKNHAIDMINDESGKPNDVYKTFLGQNGMLADQYQLNTPLDHQALDALQAKALNEGPSKWAQLAGQQAQTQADQNKSLAASQSQGAIADAASSLARKGGLTSGASERLAMGGANAAMGAQQNVGAQLSDQNQNIGIQDELQKQQALAMLPGMQQQASQYNLGLEQYNKGKPIDLAMQDYQQQMQAYAAKKAGLASLGSGKKG